MKLYLDSMLWIYFFEKNQHFYPATRSLIARTEAARSQLLSSHLVLAELLVIPKRKHDIFTATRYRRFFQSRAVTLVPLSADAAERFADIRAASHVKPADALHLALAASAGTGYFVTYDSKLHSLTIPGIAHICPPDAVPLGKA